MIQKNMYSDDFIYIIFINNYLIYHFKLSNFQIKYIKLIQNINIVIKDMMLNQYVNKTM